MSHLYRPQAPVVDAWVAVLVLTMLLAQPVFEHVLG
jgi:hypothetical protein